MPPLPSRITGMARSGIREIMDLAAGRSDIMRLEVGQPNFPTPGHIVDAGCAAAHAGYTTYTPNRGLSEVRESMAAKLARENGISVPADDIVVTCGAVNALFQTVAATVSPGEAVLVPDPGWPNYVMIAETLGVESIRYPLAADRGYQPDMEQLEKLASAKDVRALIINSPSNPTGAVFSRSVMLELAELAAANDLYLISDECYEHIVFDGEHHSPASLGTAAQVLSVFSMSKSYAMTGWRVGYVCGPPDVIDQVAKVAEPIISCATSISQKAAQAALDGDQSCVREMTASYRERRDLAVGLLAQAGILINEPAGAFYVMADISAAGMPSDEFARDLVATAGVSVAPGLTFGPSGLNVIRLSLATAADDLRLGIERIVTRLDALRGQLRE